MPGKSRTSGSDGADPFAQPLRRGRIDFASRIPLVALLDPRPAHAAAAAPFANAVNIPLAELPARTHELPPREQTVAVAGPPELAGRTIRWLQEHGRKAAAAREVRQLTGSPLPATARLWQPTEFLGQMLAQLRPGTALDLACGVGRDAVFAASAGWRVTAVDVLPDAVERGRALAARYAGLVEPIRWVVADLENGPASLTGRYDLIFGFRYLHRPLFARLGAWLAPGGSLLWETFTTSHRARHGRPSRAEHVLEPDELPRLLAGWKVVHFSEAWRGSRHTARIWAMRR